MFKDVETMLSVFGTVVVFLLAILNVLYGYFRVEWIDTACRTGGVIVLAWYTIVYFRAITEELDKENSRDEES